MSRKHKLVNIAPTTFGASEACRVIVEMMNEDKIPHGEKRRVCAFLENAKTTFKITATVENKGVKQQLLVLLRDDFLSKVDKMNYPKLFITHLKNVINFYCSKHIRGY